MSMLTAKEVAAQELATANRFAPAAVITAKTPIQHGGMASIEILMTATRQIEYLLNGLMRAIDRIEPDVNDVCDETDLAMWTATLVNIRDLSSLCQSYFSGEELTIEHIAERVDGYTTARELDILLDLTNAQLQKSSMDRGRAAEIREAAAARAGKAGKGKPSTEA